MADCSFKICEKPSKFSKKVRLVIVYSTLTPCPHNHWLDQHHTVSCLRSQWLRLQCPCNCWLWWNGSVIFFILANFIHTKFILTFFILIFFILTFFIHYVHYTVYSLYWHFLYYKVKISMFGRSVFNFWNKKNCTAKRWKYLFSKKNYKK